MVDTVKVLFALASIPVILFVVKMFVLLPIVAAKVAADGTEGTMNQIKRALHYFRNTEDLKTVYIRNGAFSDSPVNLVSKRDHEPSEHEKQS